jgi:hypothetical protein
MELIRLQLPGRHLGLIAQARQSLPVRFSLLDKRHLVHRLALIVLLVLAAALSLASGTTQITDAKIAGVTERGFILQIGSDNLTVEDTSQTKFWSGRAQVKRDSFKEGDLVTARIKTNCDPPELRELADRDSWKWLDNVRKQPQMGTVQKVDDKYLTLRLADGGMFAYRATDKSKVSLTGKPDAKVTDLEVGQKVYAKGRTLATLDTWLAEVTDVPIPMKPVKEKGSRKSRPKPVPASGKLDGLVLSHLPRYKMLDMAHEFLTLHITYTEHTKFYLDGKAVKPIAIQPQQKVVISYSRDKFGRILASKVELFTP